mgnify:CR=1 FL=1
MSAQKKDQVYNYFTPIFWGTKDADLFADLMQIAAKQAPRLYFAPFVGAITAMKKEIRALRRASNPPENKDTNSKVPV